MYSTCTQLSETNHWS